jgi:hypothetical protein
MPGRRCLQTVEPIQIQDPRLPRAIDGTEGANRFQKSWTCVFESRVKISEMAERNPRRERTTIVFHHHLRPGYLAVRSRAGCQIL